ncbi:MAG TPA: hypothetical protein PK559_05025 [Ignavibacteriaceae bacterium]|nr:hypothetical protein [Ignavibacteriaceae bacterium]
MKISLYSITILVFLQVFTPGQSISQLKNDFHSTTKVVLENTDNLQISENRERKNPGLAILYSALLPGMGELYAGDYSIGQYLTITEVALWGTYYGVEKYGDWKKDNYLSYAKSEGGVDLTNKNDEYFAKIGDYRDIYQYNDEMSAQRNFKAMYSTDTHFWKWEATSNRRAYRSLWVSSQVSYNNLRFVVGGMILNRIASIINAVRLVTAYNKNQSSNWNVSVGYSPNLINQSNLNLNLNLQF